VEFSWGLDTFRKFLQAVRVISDEVCFEVDSSGLNVRFLDSWHCAMIDSFIPKRSFIRFKCGSEHPSPFGLDVGKMLSILKSFKDGLVEGALSNIFQLKVLPQNCPKNVRIFKFPLLDTKPEDLPEPKVNFSHEVEVSTKAFLDAVKLLEKIDEYVKLIVGPDKLVFEAGEEDEVEARAVIAETEDLVNVKTTVKGYVAIAKYNLKYLLPIAKTAAKIARLMKIKLSTQSPICLQLDFPIPDGSIKYWVAPLSE